jgi:DNA ligase-1
MEPLYENNKVWSISYFENGDGSYTIKTTHGQLNGKMIDHLSLVKEGKNIGKKNETTIKEQTILEVKRDWDKKVKQGYHTANTESNTTILKPMLALEFKDNVKYPVWVQPKLDGVRCLIYMSNNEVVFQSRQNTIYEPFQHLVQDIESILSRMPPNTILDGELYTHGLGFENIVSMVRRAKNQHPNIEKLKYTMYDFFIKGDNTLLYEDRLKILTAAYHNEKNIHLIETRVASSKIIVDNFHDYYAAQEYEGIMLRSNGLYKEGRSKDLLKYKKFMDAEFVVVGHHVAKFGLPIPVFECKTGDKTFGVMMKEDFASRADRMKNVTDYYGKLLTVKFQELTSDGIPRFPVGISFRDYE